MPGHPPSCFCELCRSDTVDYAMETGPCMARVSCPRCRRHFGYCSEVEADLLFAKENRPKGYTDNTMDMGAHYEKQTGGSAKRTPFLKAKDIPAKGTSAKIVGFREAPKSMEYSDFLLDITIGKKEFTWGLRSKTVSLNMLIDELGKRTEKWTGKTIKLVRGGNKGQYVNLG